MKGKPLTQEHKEKISKSHIGLPSPMKGKHQSMETKIKIGIANTGKIRSEESLKRQSESHLGKTQSIETRNKRSITMTGKKHPNRPHPVSDKTKKRLSDINIGKRHSTETKKKISELQKGKWCLDKNPNWQGGTSFFPYCPKFNGSLKDNVRATFEFKCQFPGCELTQEETGRKHEVHHVFAEKMTCCEQNIKEMDSVRNRLPKDVAMFGEPSFTELEITYIRMMVPLCKKHHTKVGHERWDLPYEETVYRKYFSELIMNKYGGKCWRTQEETTSSLSQGVLA